MAEMLIYLREKWFTTGLLKLRQAKTEGTTSFQ